MTFQLITPASVHAVTLGEAKSHLRITDSAEDDLVEGLIKSAAEHIESETGLSLITKTYRLWIDDVPPDGLVRLPKNPLRQIVQVNWYDGNGTPTELPGSAYFLNSIARPARLKFERASCPGGLCNGIEVDFDAGYGDTGVDVPDLIRRALLILVSHWYEFRGVYGPGDQPVSMPAQYTRLIRHNCQMRL